MSTGYRSVWLLRIPVVNMSTDSQQVNRRSTGQQVCLVTEDLSHQQVNGPLRIPVVNRLAGCQRVNRPDSLLRSPVVNRSTGCQQVCLVTEDLSHRQVNRPLRIPVVNRLTGRQQVIRPDSLPRSPVVKRLTGRQQVNSLIITDNIPGVNRLRSPTRYRTTLSTTG